MRGLFISVNQRKRLAQGSRSSVLPVEAGGVELVQVLGRQWLALLDVDESGAKSLTLLGLKDVDPEDRAVGVALRCH
eukprot:1607450-Alexandrium_andersonii.AAC.1